MRFCAFVYRRSASGSNPSLCIDDLSRTKFAVYPNGRLNVLRFTHCAGGPPLPLRGVDQLSGSVPWDRHPVSLSLPTTHGAGAPL